MDQDDRMVGRVLSRREVVSLLGLSGVAMLTDSLRAQAPAAPSGPPFCVVQPQQTEGPYFSDVMLNRTDVRSDPPSGAPKPGAALALAFNVGQLSADGVCKPLAGAHVDIWQCDALGVYSDAKDRSFDTIGQKFLRGYQLTDASGAARFTTIYPGWYQGRAVHIHFKIRTNPKGPGGQEFTSQLYFDEAMTDRVHALEPYASKGKGRTLNEQDGIFKNGGRQLMLAVAEKSGGYAGTFNVALHPGMKPETGRGRGPGRGGGSR